MDEEAIQSVIRAILPSVLLTCDMVHCLGEKKIFSPPYAVVFSQFLLGFSLFKIVDEDYTMYIRKY